MYEAHFGLNKPLFPTGIAQESAVFFSARHQQFAASIKLALTMPDSAVVLTGPAGVGKTTLIASALRATSTKLALGWITVAPANAGELLELLLTEFGFNAHRVGRVERMQMWRQVLNEMSATSSRVYVIAERAEDLGADVLRALDSLTAADANGSLGANLVLLGQPALLDVLKAPTLASLCQRIRLRQQFEPLALDELRAYLDHHAKAAGASIDKLFARDALAALHDITGGIPRLVDNVGETALTLAAIRKNSAVTAELVREVAQMSGIAPAPAPASAVQPAREAPLATPAPPNVAVAPTASALAATASAPTATVNVSAPIARGPAAIPTAAPVTQTAPVGGQSMASRPLAAQSSPFAAQPSAPRQSPAQPTVAPPPVNVALSPAAAAPRAAAPTSPATAAGPPVRPARVTPPAVEPNPPSMMTVVPRAAFAPTASAAPAPAPQPTPAPRVAAAPPAAPRSLGSGAGPSAVEPQRQPARERQLMSDEEIDSFAATLTDSPDVPTLDFPVLTDAVEPARQRARTETAYVKPPAPRAAAPEPPKPATPLPRVVAAATTPPAARVKPPQPAAKAAAAVNEDADVLRQTQTMRAISVAKSIDDISNSMAETLFGDADLEKLNTALEASGWTDDPAMEPPAASPATTLSAAATLPAQAPPAPKASPSAQTAKPPQPMPAAKPAPLPADDDPFDFLGLGRDAPLELIDEPVGPQQRKEVARNR
jgi:general secretion pathway protein A